MLTEDEAREIFSQRPQYALDKNGQYTFQSGSSESPTIVGQRYNIGSRSVRDIWNRKSWTRATRPDWTPEEVAASAGSTEADTAGVIPVQIRKRGRPCSAKDAFPRVQRRGVESPSDSSVSGDSAARPSDLEDKNHTANLSSNNPTSLTFFQRPSPDVSGWPGHQQFSTSTDPSSACAMQQPVTLTHLQTQASAPASGSQQSPHNLVQQWLDLASRTFGSQNAAAPSQQNALLLSAHNADRNSAFCQPLPRQSDDTTSESGPTAQTPGSQSLSAALSLLSPQHLFSNQPPLFHSRALAPQPQDAFLRNHGQLPAHAPSAATHTLTCPVPSLPFSFAPPSASSLQPSPSGLDTATYLWRPGPGTLRVPDVQLNPQHQFACAQTQIMWGAARPSVDTGGSSEKRGAA